MLHNFKYYMKSLKSNTVKSKNVVDLFKKAGEKRSTEEELDSSGEDSESHQRFKLVMRYMLATFSLVFLGLFFFVTSKSVYYQRLVEFSQGCCTLQR